MVVFVLWHWRRLPSYLGAEGNIKGNPPSSIFQGTCPSYSFVFPHTLPTRLSVQWAFNQIWDLTKLEIKLFFFWALHRASFCWRNLILHEARIHVVSTLCHTIHTPKQILLTQSIITERRTKAVPLETQKCRSSTLANALAIGNAVSHSRERGRNSTQHVIIWGNPWCFPPISVGRRCVKKLFVYW